MTASTFTKGQDAFDLGQAEDGRPFAALSHDFGEGLTVYGRQRVDRDKLCGDGAP